jgi:O-antigen/teichoic acid export membrane protein
VTAVEEPAAAERERLADLKMVARGGSLNFIGAVANGLFQFALVVVVTRSLTRSASGAFFEAIALFLILSNTAELGADTGLTRMIPSYRVNGRIPDVRRSLSVGIVPSFAAGALLAAISFALAGPLASVFTNHRHADAGAVATYIRVLAVFLPLSSAYTVAVAATRGFGTMVPNALVDRIGRSAVQTGAVAIAVLAGGGSFAVAVAWGLPIGIAFAVTLVWLGRLVHRVERREAPTKPPTPLRRLSREFWVFTAPRGLTGVFQVTTLWVGTLLVGSLMDTAHASIYTASTRYLVAGSVVNLAIIQAIGPKLSELLTAGARERAMEVYQVATAWLVTMSWPMYIGLAVFAPLLLRVFKPDYVVGASSLEILAVTMLVATGIGPVDMVLLMGGRSFWNLFNVIVALTVNLTLSFLLIPRIGIAGAAIAWAGSILINNVLPLTEVRAFLKVHPFGRGFPVAAGSSLLCYGVLGLALRAALGATMPALVICIVVGTAGYAALLWTFRERVELTLLGGTLRSRRRRRPPASPVANSG